MTKDQPKLNKEVKKEKKTIKEENWNEEQRKAEIRRWVLKSTFVGDQEDIVDWIYKNHPTNGYYQ